MSKILITGGGGFVGSHLAEAELKAGNLVTCLDLAKPNKVEHLLDNKNFVYFEENMLTNGALEKHISFCDIVYHLAAIADPAQYCNDPALILRVDLEATQKVVKLAHKHKKKLVFASTSEIYGKNPEIPWSEDSDRLLGPASTPRWCYASAKAVGEHYCHAYGKKGLEFVILRFFNFYGPKIDALGQGRVIPCFLDAFLSDKNVEVVSPGAQTRCFTYIDDGIKGVISAAHNEKAVGKTFNLGSHEETTIMRLAMTMQAMGPFKSQIHVVSAEKRYGEGYDDIPKRVPDCSLAKELLGWEAATSLEIGLRKTIDYYRNESSGSTT